MAGNHFIERIAHPDKRLVEITRFHHAGCPQKTPMWCPLRSLLDLVAIHFDGSFHALK
jgi:hypothetical protein